MSKFSESETLEFTNDLDKIAIAIGSLRQNSKLGNGETLTSEQQDELLICQIKIFRSSARIAAQGISINTDSIREQLAELKTATASIDQTIARIASVDQVIDFATVTLNVVAAIASTNIVGVAESLNGLLGSISALNRG